MLSPGWLFCIRTGWSVRACSDVGGDVSCRARTYRVFSYSPLSHAVSRRVGLLEGARSVQEELRRSGRVKVHSGQASEM